MPKVGGRRKKHRTHKQLDQQQEQKCPKNFVFRRGRVSTQLKQTILDIRKCMYPNTAMNLQDNSNLKLSSYVRAAKYYKVTHLVSFHNKNNSKSKFIAGNFVRFIKMGGGVLTFKIINFCRSKDILNNIKMSQSFLRESNSPLLVMNNFNNKGANVKKISDMLQQMFPALNMTKIKPQNLKRVISFSYNEKNESIYFRNYRIKLCSAGVNKSIQEIMDNKNIDFSNFSNFSEYIGSQGGSTAGGSNKVKQTIRLYEVGPRLKLKFFKYEDSLNIKELPDDEGEEGEEGENGAYGNVYGEENQEQYEGMEVEEEEDVVDDNQGDLIEEQSKMELM